MYWEPGETYEMGFFAKTVNDWKSLAAFAEMSTFPAGITYSKLSIETLEQGIKYVES